MVNAESLNFDVLDLIFSYLSGQDLASVALVSRTFLEGVYPSLYRTVWYRLREGKAFSTGQVISPFKVLLDHPNLANHVRSIDIECVPFTNSPSINRQPHPTFMRECTKAMVLCRNMMAFKCTVANVLPSFLLALKNKPRLRNLRVYANLTTAQANLLTSLSELENLVLEFASWSVIHMLPSWAGRLSSSLRSLTLYMTNELSSDILEKVLEHVPHLEGLHVVNCARVDHIAILNLLKHTPHLESLSFTVTENAAPVPFLPPALPNLNTICIDARYQRATSSVPTSLSTILDYFKGTTCHLSSFSIKLPERKIIVGNAFVTKLLDLYGPSLKKLSFIDCGLEGESVKAISRECIQLERLAVPISLKEISSFAERLRPSKSLKTLIHVDNGHVHGPRPPMNQENVEIIFDAVSTLDTVVSDRRVWVRRNLPHNFVFAKIERRIPAGPRSLWFLPSNKV